MSKAPILILALQRTSTSTRYKALIWLLTFFTYTSYHLSRRPITIVKNALHKNCIFNISMTALGNETYMNETKQFPACNDTSWIPFDHAHPYQDYFGALDVSYLAGYAVGMFFSGHIAERMNLRYFLSSGMMLSGLLTMAFGFGYSWNIHSLVYFIIVQIVCGLVQSTGWPGVVTCMGNWFGKGRRGVIMAIWNAHTSLGNILGGLIAALFLKPYWEAHGYWMWSFFYPGLIIMVMGIIVFLLLVPHPSDVNLPSTDSSQRRNFQQETAPLINDTEATSDEEEASGSLLQSSRSNRSSLSSEGEKAISFINALKIPGVVEFALCLFFAKLVSYTFLYWLPEYIKQEMTEHVTLDDPDSTAGLLSTLVDVGGIFGGIFAGSLADASKSSALTCSIMLVLSIPMMVLYKIFGSLSMSNAVGLLLATGFLVNGPYCLITTSVSADLGTHPSLSSNAKALATVTAIIDGTGSIGAAIGPGITAIIEGTNKLTAVKMDIIFGILIGSNIFALAMLSRLIYKEVREIRQRRRFSS
ncbi:glucose-6-phosphate exchanger SLC37A2-like isoform X2 [Watersipora subatra]|uniref:glucose-6-phosphate exchanger SLC37A2-like isoform X2 n=1 Tax=Watersipora subatra TaxID=2589382 RepID=UPI00355B797E